jgi:hypothetical protein
MKQNPSSLINQLYEYLVAYVYWINFSFYPQYYRNLKEESHLNALKIQSWEQENLQYFFLIACFQSFT